VRAEAELVAQIEGDRLASLLKPLRRVTSAEGWTIDLYGASTPDVSTQLRDGGVETWLVEAVQRLAR